MTQEAADAYDRVKNDTVDPAIAAFAHGTKHFNENDTLLKYAVDEYVKLLESLDKAQLVVVSLIATQRAADLLQTFVKENNVDKDTKDTKDTE